MVTVFLRGFLGDCPYCGKGRLASGLFKTHHHCTHCGLVYQNAPGDFVGATVLGYVVCSFFSLTLGFILVIFTELSLEIIFGLGALLIIVIGTLTYQRLKGLWIAFLVYTEALMPPDGE